MMACAKFPLTSMPLASRTLGKPVSAIPDPYSCCPSYSAHMNKELREMLDDTGIPYKFISSTENKSGKYNEVLQLALARNQEILDVILPTLVPKTGQAGFPLCRYARTAAG